MPPRWVLRQDQRRHPKTWVANSHPAPTQCHAIALGPQHPTVLGRTERRPRGSCQPRANGRRRAGRPVEAPDRQTHPLDHRQNPGTGAPHRQIAAPARCALDATGPPEALKYQRPAEQTIAETQHRSHRLLRAQQTQRWCQDVPNRRPHSRARHPSGHPQVDHAPDHPQADQGDQPAALPDRSPH